VTYFADVIPEGRHETWKRFEAEIEAASAREAILGMREIPGVLLVTRLREFSKPSRTRWPEDANAGV
jgi:hypothetical protein